MAYRISRDDQGITELARFMSHLRDRFPRPLDAETATVATQTQVAMAIREDLERNGPVFRIPAELVREIVRGRDPAIENAWDSGPNCLAWFAVHPLLSNAAPLLMPAVVGAECYLLHHVPKSAGTTVYRALEDIGTARHYPVTSVPDMIRTHGVTGLANLCAEYRQFRVNDRRLFVCGHYSLPLAVQHHHMGPEIRGFTFCRAPDVILRSALRYVWTIKTDESELHVGTFGHIPLDELFRVRREIEAGNLEFAERACDIFEDIVNSKEFFLQFDRPLSKYYLGAGVETAADLDDLFRAHPLIRPIVDIGAAAPLLQAELGIDVRTRRENRSFMDDARFLALIERRPAVAAKLRDMAGDDARLFEVVQAIHGERSHAPRPVASRRSRWIRRRDRSAHRPWSAARKRRRDGL